jgi:HPt (histidine-containing phosphotransfer) domain-containing protein
MQLTYKKFAEVTLGDREFAIELLGLYAGQFEEYIVELSEAVEAEDWEKLRFINHKVKSSLVTLEAEDFLLKQAALVRTVRTETPPKRSEILKELAADCRSIIKELHRYAEELSLQA